jgi:adenosylhomocysteine nucleosidase
VPKRIAFICAMPMEIAPLKGKLSLERTVIDSIDMYAGSLGDHPVVAIVTGIGGVLAAEGIEILLQAVDVEHVVVVGIAGAVDDEIPIGTLVLPTMVINGATGAQYEPHRIGEHAPNGTMWTSDELITDLDLVAQLRTNGVIALDMETAMIAEICQRRNIPWSVFRALSDRATEASLDDEVFNLIRPDGSYNVKLLAAFVVKHPGRLPALARLARNAKLAAEHAAAAAIDAASQL